MFQRARAKLKQELTYLKSILFLLRKHYVIAASSVVSAAVASVAMPASMYAKRYLRVSTDFSTFSVLIKEWILLMSECEIKGQNNGLMCTSMLRGSAQSLRLFWYALAVIGMQLCSELVSTLIARVTTERVVHKIQQAIIDGLIYIGPEYHESNASYGKGSKLEFDDCYLAKRLRQPLETVRTKLPLVLKGKTKLIVWLLCGIVLSLLEGYRFTLILIVLIPSLYVLSLLIMRYVNSMQNDVQNVYVSSRLFLRENERRYNETRLVGPFYKEYTQYLESKVKSTLVKAKQLELKKAILLSCVISFTHFSMYGVYLVIFWYGLVSTDSNTSLQTVGQIVEAILSILLCTYSLHELFSRDHFVQLKLASKELQDFLSDIKPCSGVKYKGDKVARLSYMFSRSNHDLSRQDLDDSCVELSINFQGLKTQRNRAKNGFSIKNGDIWFGPSRISTGSLDDISFDLSHISDINSRLKIIRSDNTSHSKEIINELIGRQNEMSIFYDGIAKELFNRKSIKKAIYLVDEDKTMFRWLTIRNNLYLHNELSGSECTNENHVKNTIGSVPLLFALELLKFEHEKAIIGSLDKECFHYDQLTIVERTKLCIARGILTNPDLRIFVIKIREIFVDEKLSYVLQELQNHFSIVLIVESGGNDWKLSKESEAHTTQDKDATITAFGLFCKALKVANLLFRNEKGMFLIAGFFALLTGFASASFTIVFANLFELLVVSNVGSSGPFIYVFIAITGLSLVGSIIYTMLFHLVGNKVEMEIRMSKEHTVEHTYKDKSSPSNSDSLSRMQQLTHVSVLSSFVMLFGSSLQVFCGFLTAIVIGFSYSYVLSGFMTALFLFLLMVAYAIKAISPAINISTTETFYDYVREFVCCSSVMEHNALNVECYLKTYLDDQMKAVLIHGMCLAINGTLPFVFQLGITVFVNEVWFSGNLKFILLVYSSIAFAILNMTRLVKYWNEFDMRELLEHSLLLMLDHTERKKNSLSDHSRATTEYMLTKEFFLQEFNDNVSLKWENVEIGNAVIDLMVSNDEWLLFHSEDQSILHDLYMFQLGIVNPDSYLSGCILINMGRSQNYVNINKLNSRLYLNSVYVFNHNPIIMEGVSYLQNITFNTKHLGFYGSRYAEECATKSGLKHALHQSNLTLRDEVKEEHLNLLQMARLLFFKNSIKLLLVTEATKDEIATLKELISVPVIEFCSKKHEHATMTINL